MKKIHVLKDREDWIYIETEVMMNMITLNVFVQFIMVCQIVL